jgi:macrolide-specific efflux system membrane fusion protein
VNANQSAPIIIRLADLSTVTVKAQISEADVINVKRGQHLYFTILGDADKKYQATLREVESADTVSSDATTTTTTTSSSSAVYYYGWFDVPNPDGRLRIGMTATATIILDELKNVLTIPSAALGQKDASGRYKVRVASADGRVEERAVKIGLNNNAVAQVFDGVREGENVVIAEASATPAAKGSGGVMGGGMPMGGGPPGP